MRPGCQDGNRAVLSYRCRSDGGFGLLFLPLAPAFAAPVEGTAEQVARAEDEEHEEDDEDPGDHTQDVGDVRDLPEEVRFTDAGVGPYDRRTAPELSDTNARDIGAFGGIDLGLAFRVGVDRGSLDHLSVLCGRQVHTGRAQRAVRCDVEGDLSAAERFDLAVRTGDRVFMDGTAGTGALSEAQILVGRVLGGRQPDRQYRDAEPGQHHDGADEPEYLTEQSHPKLLGSRWMTCII